MRWAQQGRRSMFGGPRQKKRVLVALHPRSRVHFPVLSITPSDIIRFPPRVAGLFRKQRAHACKLLMKLHMKAIFLVLASTAENESTDKCNLVLHSTDGSMQDFGAEGGG